MSEKTTVPTNMISDRASISSTTKTTEREEQDTVQEVKVRDNISYGSLQKPPVCNENKYGDCITPIKDNNRPCTIYNRCKRDNV
ncbi:hypothetical protein CCACVL1_07541 [Corchorus capsularis]|uniref:Rapid ALkalinization Factor n=1 Tax=Corchorus capsularis TaxID=210143 RepID=A0A1R3J5E2_COCAP|nr:hypothetical protein CCACVL1_07541 [Corchorus capsularis]